MSRPSLTRLSLLALGSWLTLPALVAQTSPPAPKVFYACYDPLAGLVYRIKEPGLRDACLKATHVQFSWTDGVAGHDHGALNGLGDDDHPQYLLADGARPLTGDLSAGGKRITGLAAASADGDAVPFQQAVKSGDAAGGDLAGAYPNPTVVQIRGRAVAADAEPAAGQVLTWNGTAWAPAAVPSVGGDATLDQLVVSGAATLQGATSLAGAAQFNADGGVVFGGATGVGTIPATGAGTRVVWHPAKAAFRAGAVEGSRWDDAEVGQSSTAMGLDTKASGFVSTAFGLGASATGDASLAIGSGRTTASGEQSTAIGVQAIASGALSTALGANASTNQHRGAFVYGDASAVNTSSFVTPTAPNQFVVRAVGGLRLFTSTNTGGFTFEGGAGTGCGLTGGALTCSGTIHAASGGLRFPDGTIQTTAATPGATGSSANTGGTLVQRDASGGFAAGSVDLGQLQVSGSSTLQGATSIAGAAQFHTSGDFVVAGSGLTGTIPVEGPGLRLLWSPAKGGAFRAGFVAGTQWNNANVGAGSIGMGANATASGTLSLASGSNATASGSVATAIGNAVTASGNQAFATGMSTRATGENSTAMGSGTRAGGSGATALGSGAIANGEASVALGDRTIATGDRTTALGTLATTDNHAGSFIYGDASTAGGGALARATAPNQYVVRAVGGVRLFNSSSDDNFTFEGGNGAGCRLAAPAPGGSELRCSHVMVAGDIEARSRFVFPDGTVQRTAGVGLSDLSGPGSINQVGNPVDWTKLKGVPAAFADGVDNVAAPNLQILTGESVVADVFQHTTSVNCPPGALVTGGGFTPIAEDGTPSAVSVSASMNRPVVAPNGQQGWITIVNRVGSSFGKWGLRVSAICLIP